MNGDDPKAAKNEEWYMLKDEMTDKTVGYINPAGEIREADAGTAEQITEAFNKNLLVKDGEVIEEFGLCADGVCAIGPSDPEHDHMILRNLGALTGFRPEATDDGSDPEK